MSNKARTTASGRRRVAARRRNRVRYADVRNPCRLDNRLCDHLFHGWQEKRAGLANHLRDAKICIGGFKIDTTEYNIEDKSIKHTRNADARREFIRRAVQKML